MAEKRIPKRIAQAVLNSLKGALLAAARKSKRCFMMWILFLKAGQHFALLKDAMAPGSPSFYRLFVTT